MQLRLLPLFLSFLISATAMAGIPLPDPEGGTKPKPSKTLPILYINTQDSVIINQKETYIPASAWIDALNDTILSSLGTGEEPLSLGIRGRGNSSWTNFAKKSYKLKFDKKQEILSMPKNKHWVLRPHLGPYLGFFPDMAARWIGDRLGMPWTPDQQPVEVVLNGDYIGLYMIGESIRIDKNRIDIFEQPDENHDAATLSGGYLIELDNYEDQNQIMVREPDGYPRLFTMHTPEVLSEEQRAYLTSQLYDIISAISDPDKTSREWEKYLDLQSVARYIMATEWLNNHEGFFGSFYLYKDSVEGAGWQFGPLWDVATGFGNVKNGFTFQENNIRSVWEEELLKFPRLIKEIKRLMPVLEADTVGEIRALTRDFGTRIDAAERRDRTRWSFRAGEPYMHFQGKGAARSLDGYRNWLLEEFSKEQYNVYSAAIQVHDSSRGRARINSRADSAECFAGMTLTLSVDSLCTRAEWDGEDITQAINAAPVEVIMPAHDVTFHVTFPGETAINEIRENEATVEYYDLLGRKINNPGRGIYLRRSPVSSTHLILRK